MSKLFFTLMIMLLPMQSFGKSNYVESLVLRDFFSSKAINISKYKAVVFITYLGGCPILKKYQHKISIISSKYKKEIFFVNFDPTNFSKKNKEEFTKDYKLIGTKLELVVDPELNKTLKLSIASEVAINDLKKRAVVYRGAIDDKINYDREKVTDLDTNNYLIEGIESVLNEKEVKITQTSAIGCYLNLDE
jgi:hypothetical protein